MKALLLATLAAVFGAWCSVMSVVTLVLTVGGVLCPVTFAAGPFLGMSVPTLGMWFASLTFLPLIASLTIAAGFPTYALLAIFKLRSWQAYSCAGAFAGGLVEFVIFRLPTAQLATASEATMLLGPVAGIGGASIFWMVLRPDRV